MSLRPRTLIAVVVLVQAAGCSTMPGNRQDALQVELNARPAVTSVPTAPASINDEKPITIKKEDKAHSTAKSEIERGSGRFINEDAARAPLRAVKGGEGQITLNFESMPIQAAVQQILGGYQFPLITGITALVHNILYFIVFLQGTDVGWLNAVTMYGLPSAAYTAALTLIPMFVFARRVRTQL